MDDDAAGARRDARDALVPRRIRICGTSGSGKTTLARRVAARTGLTRVELDEVFWDVGWKHRDPEAGRAVLRGRLAAAPAGWVVDGGWHTNVATMLDDADVIVCLDLPRRTVMRRVVLRTLLRGVTRRELWHGNRESLGSLLRRRPDENIVLWSWTTWARNRARWEALEASGAPVVRLRTPREVRAWLDSLPRALATPAD